MSLGIGKNLDAGFDEVISTATSRKMKDKIAKDVEKVDLDKVTKP